uniref:Uncharacterized protein n=1 Tax=Candidatus Kentrum sp. DK TaxID=2126562 RepID=A0A450TB57_9GAMM|nr:MAG: hypothetical protein BECKDK2373C_GA0170839_11134 [Candidatus Kentron sp. DK]
MKRHLSYLSLGALLVCLTHVGSVFAVEVAPRISDREIIERLTGLETRMGAMREHFEQRFDAVEERMDTMQEQTNQRFDAMEKRMDAMQAQTEQRFASMERRMDTMQEQTNQRFDAMEKRMDAMQEQTNQRFASMERRMDDRMDAQWNLTLVMIAGIFGLIGFVVWDRKTALKPLERRFARIADDLERDLEIESPEGSRLTRLIAAAREFAPDDPRLAEHIMKALERHSLSQELPKRA